MIGSVKIILIPSRNVSEKEASVQNVPKADIFQPKGRHPNISPEKLSERWQIGLAQARERILQNNTKTESLSCNAPSKAIKGGHSVPYQESHRNKGQIYHV